MDEAGLLAEVEQLARTQGVLFHHCPDSRRCEGWRGFPDLVLVGRRGMIVAELKGPDGETSPEQDMWAWYFAEWAWNSQVNVRYRLWRPADWDSGRISAELQAIA